MHRRVGVVVVLTVVACSARTSLDVDLPGKALGQGAPEPTAATVDRSWSPRDFGARGWWHPEDASNASLTPGPHRGFVPVLPDDSGRSQPLRAWNVKGAPTLRRDTPSEPAELELSGATSTRLQAPAGSNSNWVFLHDGRGGTVVFSARPRASGVAIDTAATSFGVGLVISYDAPLERWSAEVRAARGQVVARVVASPKSAPRDKTAVVTFDFRVGRDEEAVLRIDGARVGAAQALMAPSHDPAGGVLSYGALSGENTSFFEGRLGQLAVFDRALTDEEHAKVAASFRSVPSPRQARVLWTVGDSLTNNTYQAPLHERSLRTTSVRIDFVGSLFGGESPWFVDAEHDGHTGHSIQAIEAATAHAKLSATPTDIVIVAGTNNCGTPLESAIASYARLVEATLAQFPAIPKERVWLGRIPRITSSATNRVWAEQFRLLQQSYASSHGYRSWDADASSDDELVDGVHLNAAGVAYQAAQLASTMGI